MSEHTPVLVQEVLGVLEPKPGSILLDATLGHGGHAKAFLEAAGDSSRVIGVDADPEALAVAKQTLAEFGDRVSYVQGNFFSLPDTKVTAILFDLGIGSHQIADSSRGFSFSSEAPLTMSYGEAEEFPPAKLSAINDLTQRLGHYPDAHEILDYLPPLAIADMVRMYGEERYAGVVANAIVEGRPFSSARSLAHAIENAVPKSYEKGRIHPATRTFQALRIAVNRELEVLEAVLPKAIDRLEVGGVIAVISFHSLEDRIVKRLFKKEAKQCICPPQQPVCTCNHKARLEILTKRPVVAGEEERSANPRSRSAKLRAARKISDGS